jgi:hypothetical protein
VIAVAATSGFRVRSKGLMAGTWIAVATVPIAWATGIVLAILTGEGAAHGAGPAALGLLGIVVFAGVPALAVALAVRLRRTGHRSGHWAVVVSVSLLALTLLATMLVGPLATVTVLAMMALLGVDVWRSRTRSRPRSDQGTRNRRYLA